MLLASLLFGLAAGVARAETLYERECLRVELEAGPVWQTQNEVQIPGDTGTRFDLDDLTGAGPFLGERVTVDWNRCSGPRTLTTASNA